MIFDHLLNVNVHLLFTCMCQASMYEIEEVSDFNIYIFSLILIYSRTFPKWKSLFFFSPSHTHFFSLLLLFCLLMLRVPKLSFELCLLFIVARRWAIAPFVHIQPKKFLVYMFVKCIFMWVIHFQSLLVLSLTLTLMLVLILSSICKLSSFSEYIYISFLLKVFRLFFQFARLLFTNFDNMNSFNVWEFSPFFPSFESGSLARAFSSFFYSINNANETCVYGNV